MKDKSNYSQIVTPISELDMVIHEPARLMILALLYVVESADFVFLMKQSGLTWGNLSSHMSKLEERGYIQITKTFKGKRPRTILSLTGSGRTAFMEYHQRIKKVMDGISEIKK